MVDIYAEDFHLSEQAFRALRRLRDNPADTNGYEASITQLVRKRFARKTTQDVRYRLTTLGELFLGLGHTGRQQLAGVTGPSLQLILNIVAHRGNLPAAEADHRMMRAIGANSSRRWARERMGEERMVVEATAQGLAVAQLVSHPLTHSQDPEDERLLLAVRSCQPETTLFPALARGAQLEAEDLPGLYYLRDHGYAELVDPSMAPPPRRNAQRFRGAPVWRFTAGGSRKAQLLKFPVLEPPPATPDPVQPLPLGSGQTLRALVQGETLVAHDEHRLRDLEVLRLAERLVPDDPEESCLWRPTRAGVVLATVELHARANAGAVECGIPEPGAESGYEATVRATFGPPNQERSTAHHE